MAPLSKLRKFTRSARPTEHVDQTISTLSELAGNGPLRADFEEFVETAEPRLRRAFAGIRDHHIAKDAVGAALAWSWENWDHLQGMANPVGYLYRVGQSATRPPQDVTLILPAPPDIGLLHVEPALIPALAALPERQRVAVWLVHGCEWTQREVAVALEISPSTVATHVDRALITLRTALSASNKPEPDTETPSSSGGHHDS